MCGICGEVTFNGVAAGSPLAAMTQKMRARGPDAGGAFAQDRRGIRSPPAEHHRPCRRVAATDDRPGARPRHRLQRLHLQLPRLAQRAFRQGLPVLLPGRYRSHPQGLCRMGHRAASNGFTACSPSRSGSAIPAALVLARDRLGIKPLYYVEAARPLPLRLDACRRCSPPAASTPRSIRRRCITIMSWHAVVPAPMTILKGVRKLPAATICTIEPDGRRHEETYWQLEVGPRAADRGMTEADWREAVRDALGKAVERRRVADVPVGVLLSGGLDSSLLVALLAESGPAGSEDLLGRLRDRRRRRGRRIPLFRSDRAAICDPSITASASTARAPLTRCPAPSRRCRSR